MPKPEMVFRLGKILGAMMIFFHSRNYVSVSSRLFVVDSYEVQNLTNFTTKSFLN